MLAGFPLSIPRDTAWIGLTKPGRGVTGRWFMDEQVSTNGVLIDYSGNGHHGYYGGVKRTFIGDDITGPRVCLFGAVASNTVTVAGLDNTTIYDLIITYHDDTTDTHTLTTSGAGLMTMTASSDAKFTSKRVKSVAIYTDGGTPLVDTVDFTAQAQGTVSFVTGGSRTVTVNQSADTAAMPTTLWWTGTNYVYFPGTASNTVTVAGLSNNTIYDYTVTYLDTTTATGTATSDGSGNLVMGATAAEFSAKNVTRIVVTADGGGATVADVNFSVATFDATHTTFTCVTGQACTIGRSATGLKSTVVTENVCVFDGVDDYISIDDHARLNFAAAESLTCAINWRMFGAPSSAARIITKGAGGTFTGWRIIWNGTTLEPRFHVGDGTANCNAPASGAVTAGAKTVMVGRRNVATDLIDTYLNGTIGTPTTDTTNGTLTNTSAVMIGMNPVVDNFSTGQFTSAALFRRALSAAQILRLNGEM